MTALVGQVQVAVEGNLGPLERDFAKAQAMAQRFDSSMRRALGGIPAGINNATAALTRFNRSLTSTKSATDGLANSVKGALHGIAGTVAAALSVNAINEYANAWTRVTRSLEAGERVFDIMLTNAAHLNALANEARVDVEAYAKTYIRTAAAIRDYGFSSETAEQVTSTLAKALKLGSASASEQAATILQFSQALQKGKLDGDEFRTVMENASVVQELLAKRLGVTKGEIIKLAGEGKLKLLDLVGAMTDGGEEVNRIFNELPVTVDEAAAVLVNRTKQFIGGLNDTTGATQGLARALLGIGNNLDAVAGIIGGAATLAVLKLTAATNGLTAALLRNPLGLIGVALATVIGLLIAFRSETIQIGQTTVSVGNTLSAIWTTVSEAISIAGTALAALGTTTYKFVTFDWSGATNAAKEAAGSIAASSERIRDAWADITKVPAGADRMGFGENFGRFITPPTKDTGPDADVLKAYEKRANAIRRQVEAMKLEAETYGMTEAASTRYRIAKELENAATEAGIVLSTKQRLENLALADEAARNKALTVRQGLEEGLMTPDQQFAKQMEKLNELYGADAQNYAAYQALKAQYELEGFDRTQALLQTETDMRRQTVDMAIGLLGQFAGKNKAAAIAAIGLSKAMAAADIVINTARATMAAAASSAIFGPAAAAASAASMQALGAIQLGIVAATGALEIGAAAGKSGSSVPSAPSIGGANSDTSSAPSAAATQSAAPSQTVFITVQGERVGREEIKKLIRQINDVIDDGGAELRLTPEWASSGGV